MDIKIIKTKSQYDEALKQLSDFMDRKEISMEIQDKIELLILVLQDYEKRQDFSFKADPIEAIKFRMEQMGLSKGDMTLYLGSPSKVSEVLSGKRNLSMAMIRKLHRSLGIPLESLLSSQPKRKILRRAHKQRGKTRSLRSRAKKGSLGAF